MTQGIGMVRPVQLDGDVVRMIDQTELPERLQYLTLRDEQAVFDAIRGMKVRGAPAIGIAAAFGYYLAARGCADTASMETMRTVLRRAHDLLASSRPTAVNLFWALQRMQGVVDSFIGDHPRVLTLRLREEALHIQSEDEQACRAMGEHSLTLMEDGMGVLTHCNTGALATSQYGTALAGFYLARERGWDVHVYADETRPLLQGARLTAWELQEAGVKVTLICDNMAATVMAQGKVQAVMVGADRIARNGDTANKIGTHGVAVLAKHFQIPFYVVAPVSTFDGQTETGADIPIEERGIEEVVAGFGRRTAPENVDVYNPAFDVTPHPLITAIITERGVLRAPYGESIGTLLQS